MSYSSEERAEIALAVAALSELMAESDAFLAREVETHASNMSAFTGRRRVDAVSVKGMDRLLERYGFAFSSGEGLIPDASPACPVIRIAKASPDDTEAVRSFLALLAERGASVYLCDLAGALAGVALIAEFSNVPPDRRYWCAVSLDWTPTAELARMLGPDGIERRTALPVSAKTARAWTLTAPRREEVVKLLADQPKAKSERRG